MTIPLKEQAYDCYKQNKHNYKINYNKDVSIF